MSKLIFGVNDLLTCFPDVAAEWHPTKNGELMPSGFSAMSGKKVWWRCKNGHEWEAIIANRSKGRGCPYCSNRIVLKGLNDLATTNPDIAKEWFYDKNAPLSPNEVTAGSNKKVWWRDQFGHEWQTSISHRTSGQGCPICCRQQRGKTHLRSLIKMHGSLLDLNPDLAKEWHPTKNGEMTPADVTVKSNVKAWWICQNGHEWQTSINHRSSGRGCPICSIAKRSIAYKSTLLEERGSLLDAYPQIAKEWHPTKNGVLLPSDFTPTSGKRVWWLCKHGHEWEATIANRSFNEKGCPYCSNQRVLKGYNDMATTNPELAAEWDYSKNVDICPERITSGSNKDAFWICSLGHSYKMRISHRKAGHGCPYCSGIKILAGFNDLSTWAKKNNPKLIEKWDYEQNGEFPEAESVSSQRIVWWKCKACGYSYRNKIANECNNFLCPKCNKRNKTSFPEQALYFYLKQLFPDAINSYFDEDITELDIYIPSINVGIEYDGQAWHSGKDAFIREHQKYIACKSHDIWLIRFRESLLDCNMEEICDEWHKSSYIKSIEAFGEEIESFLSNYGKINVDIQNDRNKIFDSYISVIHDKSLSNLFPNIAKEWDYEKNKPIKPDMIPAYINEKFYFICPKGHSYMTVVSKRSMRGDGCPFCSNHRVLSGYNDFATLYPDLVNEWLYEKNTPLEPTQVLSGSSQKVWWKCEYGHEWQAAIASRCIGTGCPVCARNRLMRSVINLDTNEHFMSISEAAKTTGVNFSSINQCCKGNLKTAGGYRWKYADQ